MEREEWERMRAWMYADLRKRNLELLKSIKRVKILLEKFKNEEKRKKII